MIKYMILNYLKNALTTIFLFFVTIFLFFKKGISKLKNIFK